MGLLAKRHLTIRMDGNKLPYGIQSDLAQMASTTAKASDTEKITEGRWIRAALDEKCLTLRAPVNGVSSARPALAAMSSLKIACSSEKR